MGALVDAAAGFLGGPGHGLARRALLGLGLPADLAEDLVQETLLRALRVEQRGEEIANAEAFTTVLLQRAARDLVRGIRRRPEGHVVDEEPVDLVGGDGADAPVLDGLQTAAVREVLARRLTAVPRAAAGALAVVAVVVDGAEPAEDCPSPLAGAGEQEAVAWAGLFYSGRLDCFARPGARDDDATRKRRSRAVQEQRQVLREAVAATSVVEGHGG